MSDSTTAARVPDGAEERLLVEMSKMTQQSLEIVRLHFDGFMRRCAPVRTRLSRGLTSEGLS